MTENESPKTQTTTGPTVPTGTGPTIPTAVSDSPAVPFRGLALARSRRATGTAQEAALTLAEIVLGQMKSDASVDDIGEIRFTFADPSADVAIEFPGGGTVVILDRQGECVAIYRDPPGESVPCVMSSGTL